MKPLWIFLLACVHCVRALPNGFVFGCSKGNISAMLPFCDVSLPISARVADLASRLTLDEMLGLLGSDTVNTNVSDCSSMDAGVLRLGIPCVQRAF